MSPIILPSETVTSSTSSVASTRSNIDSPDIADLRATNLPHQIHPDELKEPDGLTAADTWHQKINNLRLPFSPAHYDVYRKGILDSNYWKIEADFWQAVANDFKPISPVVSRQIWEKFFQSLTQDPSRLYQMYSSILHQELPPLEEKPKEAFNIVCHQYRLKYWRQISDATSNSRQSIENQDYWKAEYVHMAGVVRRQENLQKLRAQNGQKMRPTRKKCPPSLRKWWLRRGSHQYNLRSRKKLVIRE